MMVFSSWTSMVTYIIYCIIMVHLNYPFWSGEIKKIDLREKDMAISVHEAVTQGTFWVHVFLKLHDFPQIIHQIVPSAWDFLPIKFFNCYFKNSCFQLPKNVHWTNKIMLVTSASTGISGIRWAHYIS